MGLSHAQALKHKGGITSSRSAREPNPACSDVGDGNTPGDLVRFSRRARTHALPRQGLSHAQGLKHKGGIASSRSARQPNPAVFGCRGRKYARRPGAFLTAREDARPPVMGLFACPRSQTQGRDRVLAIRSSPQPAALGCRGWKYACRPGAFLTAREDARPPLALASRITPHSRTG